MLFIESHIAEKAFDMTRLKELKEEQLAEKETQQSQVSLAETLEQLEVFKKEVGISWPNSFKL
jgi:hypothetical protein